MHISEEVPSEPAKEKPNFFPTVAFASHFFSNVSKRLSVAVKISGAVLQPACLSCGLVHAVRRSPANSPWLGCWGGFSWENTPNAEHGIAT